jgi:hypothetical protein
MSSRIRRSFFRVAGGILLVLVAGALLVPRLVPSSLITERIVQEVERATGAEMTLASARVAWRGGLSVTLAEGALRGTGDALATATGSPNELVSFSLAFEELSVLPALSPLFRKQVKIQAIQLVGPRILVVGDSETAAAAGYRLRIAGLNLGLDETGVTPFKGKKETPLGDLLPAGLAFSFHAQADTLVLQDAAYTRLDLEGRFADKILNLNSLTAGRSRGSVTGNLTLSFVENPWGHLDFEAGARQVPAGALLEPWVPEIGRRLDCDLDVGLTGACDLRDEDTIRKTLAVNGWVGGRSGIVHARDWLQDVTPYLGNRQDLTEVRFRSLVHHFVIDQGRYVIQELTLAGGDTDWRGQGWVDLEGSIAMAVDVKLPPGFTPELGNFSFLAETLRDPQGRIGLPLKLSGRSNRPTVGLDLGRLLPR